MPRVDFYDRVKEVKPFIKKLLQTIYQRNQRLLILLDNEVALRELNVGLWCISEEVFLPHCDLLAKEANYTPLLLATSLPADHPSLPNTLLNLTTQLPDIYALSFERILEIGPINEITEALTQKRLDYYQNHGFEIVHHDMVARRS